MSEVKFPGFTLPVSDTVDKYERKMHINVRAGKVTMVHRWKDRKSNKKHTQRVTLDDMQTARLLAALTVATEVTCADDDEKKLAIFKKFGATTAPLVEASGLNK